MAEGGVGTCPQVFVVDRQASYISQPSGKGSRWPRVSQKFLLLLVGLTLLGVVVEGCFIYRLYKKTEEFSLCKYHPLCQNLSHPQTSGQQGGAIMRQVGPKESNEIPTVPPHLDQVQQKPFAHLTGSTNTIVENKVVVWVDVVTHSMVYNGHGRLSVEKEGYYYLYSKLTLNAAEECSVIQHKVMKDTSAYNNFPIVLMRSKSNRCYTQTRSKASGGEDLWNSFLAGIFLLQSGDKIYVTLENITKIHPGLPDNFMGAFMISPANILQ
ncbi:tumor necrosis factor ligand superfamily member 14 [Anarrhichthys ocellatus]|uniref:tumor necrosis factor ligand superfamily member 14 n=1 Tax=Anarrhichthys ocellatus TaxID=433405 RepID=UPI0012EE3D48|nr:tumor necrosis factor ligand superfamily member 14-like [Anarrhichthys ocellatus]